MAKVTFKESHEGDGLVANVDLVTQLKFGGGTTTVDLADGIHHLFWSAFGPPQANVTMSITAPKEAAFTQSDLIGPQMHNAWAHEFHVGAAALEASATAAKAGLPVPDAMKGFVAKGSKGKKGGQ